MIFFFLFFLRLIPSACEKRPSSGDVNKPQMRPAQEEEPRTRGYICCSHSQSSGGVGETSESREASPQCHRDVPSRDESVWWGGGQEARRRQCCCCYIGRCHAAEPETREKAFLSQRPCRRLSVFSDMFMHEANFMAWFSEGKRHILHKNDGYCLNLKAPNGAVRLYCQFYTEILYAPLVAVRFSRNTQIRRENERRRAAKKTFSQHKTCHIMESDLGSSWQTNEENIHPQ